MGQFILIIILILFIYYIYKFTKRSILFIKKNNHNKKILITGICFIIFFIVINIFSLLLITGLHFLAFSFVLDILIFIFKLNVKETFIYSYHLIPILLTLIVVGYGYYNVKNIIETKYEFYTEKEIDDIRVLLITDAHYGDILNKKSLNKIKRELDEVDADIILLGGDIVDESTTLKQAREIFKVFGSIKNKYGIYFVYGNHDEQRYTPTKNYSSTELEKIIEKNNITILNDEYVEVTDDIIVAGRIDYSYKNRLSVSEILKDVDKDKYIIMIDHQPVEYEEEQSNGVDLLVSGHTHAGQIYPAEYVIKLFHTADLCYGNVKVNDMEAVVSSGIGGWGYPIRTEKHSEYVVIDIKGGKNDR